MSTIKYKSVPKNPVTLGRSLNRILYKVPRNGGQVFNYYNRSTLNRLHGVNPMTRGPIRSVHRVVVTNFPPKKRAMRTVKKFVKRRVNSNINRIYRNIVNRNINLNVLEMFNPANVNYSKEIIELYMATNNPNQNIIKLMKRYPKTLYNRLYEKRV